jgi:uncharacterized membrane protein
MISLPLLAVLGTPVLWALLPFLAAAIAALWWALERSYGDGAIFERLELAEDQVRLQRDGPRGQRAEWHANPHWVEVTLYPKGGPVPHYITLRGSGREVEIGAFLSEEERVVLYEELRSAFDPSSPA